MLCSSSSRLEYHGLDITRLRGERTQINLTTHTRMGVMKVLVVLLERFNSFKQSFMAGLKAQRLSAESLKAFTSLFNVKIYVFQSSNKIYDKMNKRFWREPTSFSNLILTVLTIVLIHW